MPDVPVVELYASNNPFDLKPRSGNHAFEDILKPLKTVWDGTAQTFPSFSSILTRIANGVG